MSITIEGSNAPNASLTLGSVWTLLYNGTTGLAADPGRMTFGETLMIRSSIWYSSFRLLITAKRSSAAAVQYAEVEFLT